MAGPNAQPQAGGDGSIPPQMDDSADWQALAKELEGEDPLLGEGEPEPAARRPREEEGNEEPPARRKAAEKEEDGEGEEERPRPTYEQLESSYRNTTSALRQARAQEKEARETLANITRMVETLRQGRQQQDQPAPVQQPQPKQPTIEEDPVGYFKHELAKRDQVIEQLKTGTAQSVQQVQQNQQLQQFIGEVERSERDMRAKTPDYDDACMHLEQGRINELAILLPDSSQRALGLARQAGFQTVEQLRMQMLNNDRVTIARQAMQLGMSPAELYYSLAKQRGYTAKAGDGKLPARQANGQFKQPKEAEEKLETAKRGHRAARSIGGGSGGAQNDLNVDDLVDLYSEDPEEFDKQWEKMARSGRLG